MCKVPGKEKRLKMNELGQEDKPGHGQMRARLTGAKQSSRLEMEGQVVMVRPCQGRTFSMVT